jgi:ABC-type sulfate transport system permease component
MEVSIPLKRTAPTLGDSVARRYQEFKLIARDPVLLVGLLITGAFMLAFIIWPLARVIWQGFFVGGGQPNEGQFSLEYFQNYVNPTYTNQYWTIFIWTMEMGVGAAIGSTIVGFLFAYAMVRCDMPFKRAVHAITLVPTISPPFAIALAAILLFGRSGLVTKELLHIRYGPGDTGVYGLGGIVFVQIITFFPVAYLIIRGLLERIDPSMEEAAHLPDDHASSLDSRHCRFVPPYVRRIAGRLGQPNLYWRQRHRPLDPDLDRRQRRVQSTKRRRVVAHPAAADVDGLPVAALLGLAQIVYLSYRKADGRRSRLCQRALDSLDL